MGFGFGSGFGLVPRLLREAAPVLLESLVELSILVVTSIEVDGAWLHLVRGRAGARVRARARAGIRVRVRVRARVGIRVRVRIRARV